MSRAGGAWTSDLRELNATRAGFGLPPAGDGLAAWESVDLVLVTAPRWFDVTTTYPPHVVHAGPLGVRATASSVGDRPVVAVTFSTTEMAGQAALVQRVCGALEGRAIEAVLTLGGIGAAPSAVPRNVTILTYADHDELFPRCAAVVTHGGLGTVLRALAPRRPLLMLPLGRDQHLNAERVAGIGAGIQLAHDAATERIGCALEQLIATPGFRRAAAAAAARIAADEPERSALRAVEATRRPR
jgi:UDP:flavonoid glycosyltransferase YjiC (YdhE family)